MKRKGPPEAASAGDNKRARPSTPVDDELEDEGWCHPRRRSAPFPASPIHLEAHWLSDRDRDAAGLPADNSKMDGDGASSKRRHSRPLELDSEGEENDTSGKEEELLSDREEEPEEAPDRLLSGKVPLFCICCFLFFRVWTVETDFYTPDLVFRKVEPRKVMMRRRETRPVRAAPLIPLMMVRRAASLVAFPPFPPEVHFPLLLFLLQKMKVHLTPRRARTPRRQAQTPRSMR